ncbi:MAG: outer membrane protein assembly factor BamB [Porticoccaceae bacterium]
MRRPELASRLNQPPLQRQAFNTLILYCLCGLLYSLPVAAQDRPIAFREAVSVDVETQVVKTLETAREHIIEGQWEPAVSILQELIDSSDDTLIPVEVGRYSNTGDYCHLLISQFPDAGLQAYRDRVDAQAREWFEAGQLALDETLLLRVIDDAFNSSFGDEALWLSGELAFERGQYALARQYWSLLVPSVVRAQADSDAPAPDSPAVMAPAIYLTYPDPSPTKEEVLARLVLCSIFEGDAARADSELAVCRTKFPDATGTLAGRTGKLVDILADVTRETSSWNDVEALANAETAPGGQLSRSGLPGATPQTREMIWRQSIPRNRFQGPTSRTALETEAPPPYFPLVDQGVVFVCGADSVFAFDLATGRAKWAIDDNDDGSIYSNILERPVTPHLPPAGLAWYALCLSEGRLYARMGPPVIRRSRNEGNSFSEIIGLDVAQREGELAFHVTSDVLDPDAESPEATSWSFEGTPLVSDGRVYVSARRGFPEDETVVACFDANSSRLLWKRKVCASLKTAGDRFNLIGQNLLTLGDGRLFLTTGTGAVAALDAATGRIQWVVTYQSDGKNTPHELSDPRRHGLAPCVFHRGIVYAAPNDSNLIYALDAATGHPVWRQQYPDRILHIVGVIDGRLILSGQSIWAVDASTGASAWPQRIGFADPAGRGYGRPALSHDFLYWPTRDEILRIDHRRGIVVGRIRLREDFRQSGGNLVIADGKLLIAQPDGLVALGSMNDGENRKPTTELKAQPKLELPPGTASRRRERSPSHSVSKNNLQLIAARLSSNLIQVSQAATSNEAVVENVPLTATSRKANNRDLWPARRAWQTTLPNNSHVWFPEVTSVSRLSEPVVTNAGQLQLIDHDSGQVRWSVNIAETVNQVAVAGDVMAFVSSASIVARNRHDGRLVWRRVFRAGDSGRFDIRNGDGDQRFLVITESMVAELDARDGSKVWSWPPDGRSVSKPAADRFPADWTIGPDRLLFRPAGSQDFGLIDLHDGRLLRRGSLPFSPAALIKLSTNHGGSRTGIVGLDSDNQIRTTQLAELGVQWKYKASGTTHGLPEILTAGTTMVVIEGRQFATRIDIETGNPLWRRPISTTPIGSVGAMAVLTSETIFVASDRIVRAFSGEDGSSKWERYLGPGQWRIRQSDGALICVQSSPEGETKTPESTAAAIVILDLSNGEIVQRLRFDSELSDNDVSIEADRCIVRSGNQLVGFKHWPANDAGNVPRL